MTAPRSATAACAARSGFTLVELLVVVLIVGVLIAVAAPPLLGETDRAKDNVAQQTLANALTGATAESASAGQQGFPAEPALAAAMQAGEPQYAVHPYDEAFPGYDPSRDPNDVSVATGGGDQTVQLCVKSATGRPYCEDANPFGRLSTAGYERPARGGSEFSRSAAQAAQPSAGPSMD